MSGYKAAMSSERDVAMDYLKGYACLMMIVGHFPVFDKSDQFALNLQFTISYATMLFFGINGVNAVTQASKYSLRYMVLLSLGLFIFGTSYSVIVHQDLYQRYVFEILQTISIGSVCVALVYKVFGFSNWIFVSFAFFVVVLKFILDIFLPNFNGGGLLLAHGDYVPHISLKLGETKFFPGFPLLPWLFIFFWGGVVYRLSQKAQAFLTLVLIMIFVAGSYFGVLGDWREKWDMSLSYLLLSMIYFSLHFFVIRLMPERWLKKQGLIMLFGRQSLAFLFVHGAGLLAAFLLVKTIGQYGAWLMAVLVTYIGLVLLEKWNGLKLFEKSGTWLVLAVLSVALPVFVSENVISVLVVLFAEFIIGILVSKHFGQYRNLIKKGG